MATKTKPASPVRKKVLHGETVRVVATRDSAVTILRKMKVAPGDYAVFLSKLEDGRWAAQTGRAQEFLDAKDAQYRKRDNPVKRRRIQTQHTGSTTSIAGECLRLFLEGKTAKEVQAIIQPKYNLPEEKSNYAAWYQSYFRRNGKLVKPADKS